MHMGKETREVRKKRADYSHLMKELKKQRVTPPAKKSGKKKRTKQKPPPISPDRQRIMSNEKIRFFFSEEGGKIHDKSCYEARKIPDEKLRFSGEYRSDLPQCRLCAVKAYVRLGAKDFYNLSNYEKLFERMELTPELLQQMYVKEGMRTTAGAGCLTVWGKEDVWRLELTGPSNALRLMHNNYYGTPDGSRRFTQGYHVQLEPVSAKYAITTIAGYTYEGHKAAAARRAQEVQERQRRLEAVQTPTLVSMEGFPKEDPVVPERGQIFQWFLVWLGNVLSKVFHK